MTPRSTFVLRVRHVLSRPEQTVNIESVLVGMKLNLVTAFSEIKSPARLPVSRRASTRASTLVCFGKVESVTERLESVLGKDGDNE